MDTIAKAVAYFTASAGDEAKNRAAAIAMAAEKAAAYEKAVADATDAAARATARYLSSIHDPNVRVAAAEAVAAYYNATFPA